MKRPVGLKVPEKSLSVIPKDFVELFHFPGNVNRTDFDIVRGVRLVVRPAIVSDRLKLLISLGPRRSAAQAGRWKCPATL